MTQRRSNFMRRVQLFIAASLDGFIASPDGDIGWLFMDVQIHYQREREH